MNLDSLLNSSGRAKVSKYGPDTQLWSSHFKTIDSYYEYKAEKEIAPWVTELLDGVESPESIDTKFLRNLCRILSRMQDEIGYKADREPDPYE